MELAVSKHRWSLRLLGIWPNRDSLSDLRFLIAITLITLIVVPQLVDLCQNYRETGIDNLSSLIPCILVSVKLIIFRINISKIRECLNAVAQDWEDNLKEVNDRERKELRYEFLGIMKRYAKIGSIFNIACTCLLYLTASGFLSLPFTVPDSPSDVSKSLKTTRNLSHSENPARTTRLPLRAIYFYDPSKSSPIFELTYLSQCIGIFVGATANFAIDSFLALLVLHFCGQLKILGRIIEHYRGGPINEHDKSVKIYSGYCPCINCIVERHLRIIRFSTILENSFHPMLLVQLFGNSILFCFLGYQIIMNYEDSEPIGIVTFLVYMFTMMFHLFLYSYVGEEMMEKSGAIGYSAYKTTWYDLKPNASKPLIMLMSRSKTTLRITAGKFFVMSFATYTDILKTSVTYLSVLRAVKPVTDG